MKPDEQRGRRSRRASPRRIPGRAVHVKEAGTQPESLVLDLSQTGARILGSLGHSVGDLVHIEVLLPETEPLHIDARCTRIDDAGPGPNVSAWDFERQHAASGGHRLAEFLNRNSERIESEPSA